MKLYSTQKEELTVVYGEFKESTKYGESLERVARKAGIEFEFIIGHTFRCKACTREEAMQVAQQAVQFFVENDVPVKQVGFDTQIRETFVL